MPGMRQELIVPVSYLMNGLNIGLSLYFAVKTAMVAYKRRTPIWYILLILHSALFLSTVETVSDIIIWNSCRGGRFSCFMYGLFYLGVTSVGFLRLYMVSGKNRMYLALWAACGATIIGSYGSLCGPAE
ncbi:hypothetical protein HDV00_005473 [Rhizophlyctis rosea]|nr:hypothetical protein HDV00_005473 [Rhizophlyctis rosea]